MGNILVAKKTWSNEAAFISMDERTKTVSVYGKSYNARGEGSLGPSTGTLETLPEELWAEVNARGGWNAPMSANLRCYCTKIWVKAKEANPKFKYEV